MSNLATASRLVQSMLSTALATRSAPALRTFAAVDFLTGQRADFARATDAKGRIVSTTIQGQGELYTDFTQRAHNDAMVHGAQRLVVGGLRPAAGDATTTHADEGHPAQALQAVGLPNSVLRLPDGPLHQGQIDALATIQSGRFTALRCGRRFGKTALITALAIDDALLGRACGIFAPTYKLSAPTFMALDMVLGGVADTSNKSAGYLSLPGGGSIECWSLEHERAGRSRKYHRVLIDEAAFGGPDLSDIYDASILATTLDYSDFAGDVVVASTPNGIDESNFFYKICHQTELGFTQFHAPSSKNPFLPAKELDRLSRVHHPLIFRQEFLAEFVDLSGLALFSITKLLVDGVAPPVPKTFDIAFAVIDSAVKGGSENDAAACVFFGLNVHLEPRGLFILDWDAVEVGAADVEQWLLTCEARLQELTGDKVRLNEQGIYIEGVALGEMLLAKFPHICQPIPSHLVARGKDLRALAAEPLVNEGQVKITDHAFNKTLKLKGVVRNHLLAQFGSFRVGDKQAYRRADDLLDAGVYGILLAYDQN
ncbi:hypothetical protein [Rhodoblastus sp.]|jgi:hypothetical protein|uniref:hypothetical protein n=1 Tax=Rhodoblastus sp. TaxID=1962975 RepID=UPI0025FE8348|nr:hypothetical protein [Rhodoblastus sp.]